MNNGPTRELTTRSDHLDETVYCVNCGSVFVSAIGRDCPACHLAERLDEVDDE